MTSGVKMKKIQKKYYLSERTAKWVRDVAHKIGISQSCVVEAAIILGLAQEAMKRKF